MHTAKLVRGFFVALTRFGGLGENRIYHSNRASESVVRELVGKFCFFLQVIEFRNPRTRHFFDRGV